MRYILSLIVGSVLLSGCITKNYYCQCGAGCQCSQADNVSPSPCNKDGDGPVVSPDKIDNSSQDDKAPQMHNEKPWYIL